jgi:prepilin-type processing-associated H-X9-DG protein
MNNYWLRWNQYTNNKEAAKGYLAQMRSRLSRNSPDRWLACDHWGTYTFSTDGLWRPHTGGVNVLFIDGHINFCKTTLTSETYPEPYKLIPELTGSWGKTNP